jgi:hypothetical protein
VTSRRVKDAKEFAAPFRCLIHDDTAIDHHRDPPGTPTLGWPLAGIESQGEQRDVDAGGFPRPSWQVEDSRPPSFCHDSPQQAALPRER